MRIRTPGKIRNNLWFLGREESCVYLVEGRDESMIISGGFSYIVPELLLQLEAFQIDESKITKLLILHSHFDHVGIVPFFKRRCPDLTLMASRQAWETLKKPKVIEITNETSHQIMTSMGMLSACSDLDLAWRADLSGPSVSQGDRIDLGGVEISIFETPGHSSCSISAYIPQFQALFPSDGGGVPYKQTIIILGTSNYTQFQLSLEKLKDLEVEFLCSDHYGYITGKEGRDYIKRAIRMAGEKRSQIESIYQNSGDLEAAVDELVKIYQFENASNLVPMEVYQNVYRQMVKHIVKAGG